MNGAMNSEAFRLAAEEALEGLPEQFRRMLENVVIITEDFPSLEIRRDMQLESPYELLGLYDGEPVTERPAVASGNLPDMIYLYRRPILAACDDTGEEIGHCIRHVLIHEIGHHFGYSDEEMERIENEPEGLTA